MQCTHCGGMNRKDDIQCFACGEKLRMVPDYNPIEDDILLQVQGAINAKGSANSGTEHSSRSRTGVINSQSPRTRTTAQLSCEELERRLRSQTSRLSIEELERKESNKKGGKTNSDRSGKKLEKPKNPSREQVEKLSPQEIDLKRRRAAAKRKELHRKQKKMLLWFAIIAGLLLGVIGYVLYINSYAGIVGKANSQANAGEYNGAVITYNKGITKNSSKTEAYEGLAGVYVAMEDLPQAQITLQQGVDANPEKIDMYLLMIQFYMGTDQYSDIMPFIKTCKSDAVLEKLGEYYVAEPVFSLDEKIYEDVQELSITSTEDFIYYTVDGSDVTMYSDVYSEAIQISEGTTVVQAIAFNSMGIPSVLVKKEYTVELPIEGAPIVSPSTGQYDVAGEITVQVPNGYTAHYTLDGSVPDENSTEYKKGISMPEGNTIFSVILINGSGRSSDITKRNYELVLP